MPKQLPKLKIKVKCVSCKFKALTNIIGNGAPIENNGICPKCDKKGFLVLKSIDEENRKKV